MGVTIAMGVAKLALSYAGEWVRRIVPARRASWLDRGRVGAPDRVPADAQGHHRSAGGIPVLGLILVGLVGRIALPGRIPGALAAVVVGSVVYALEHWAEDRAGGQPRADRARGVAAWPFLADPRVARRARRDVGRAVGRAAVRPRNRHRRHRQHRERHRCGRPLPHPGHPADRGAGHDPRGRLRGVVQNTPYVGHPAYKAMGARAGYTLGDRAPDRPRGDGGVVSILVGLVPEAAVGPILIFVGLEITAQAFRRHASPSRSGCGPRLRADDRRARDDRAAAASSGSLGLAPGAIQRRGRPTVEALCASSGTASSCRRSWAAAAAAMIIDRRLLAAAAFLAVGSLGSLCGLIHSPLASGGLFWPGGSEIGVARAPSPAATASWPASSCCSLPGRRSGRRDQRRPGPAPRPGGARLTLVRRGVTQKSMLVNSSHLPDPASTEEAFMAASSRFSAGR